MAIPQKVRPIVDVRNAITELATSNSEATERIDESLITLGALSAATDESLSSQIMGVSNDLDDYKLEDQVFVSSSCPTDAQDVSADDFALNNVWLDISNMVDAVVSSS